MNIQYDLKMYDDLWYKDWQNLQEIELFNIIKTKSSPLSHNVSRTLRSLFHINDLFISSKGFQLITLA